MTTAGSRAILPRLAAFTFDLCLTKKEKEVERSKVTLSRFFAQELGFVVANPSITLNTIHYKQKRLYTKKNSYLMSRISCFIIPDKIHIAHLFSSTFDNQSNNVLSTISRTFAII